MNALFEITLSNVAMAVVLAVPAALASVWGRRPALTHGLWLLVMLKLVTPPLFRVPVPWPEPEHQVVDAQPMPDAQALEPAPVVPFPIDDIVLPPNWFRELAVPPPLPDVVAAPEPAALEAAAPEVTHPNLGEPAITWMSVLAWIWVGGSAGWLATAAWRFQRFQAMLRFAQPASADLQAEADSLAAAMGLRPPKVLLLAGTVSPMLWTLGGRAQLLLPAGLLERLSATKRATLLAHELAHWRRGDHRVRWLELAVFAVYWWCPLAWWAHRQLHQAEEECCDAWVVAMLPDSAREYALALVDTIDFLSGALSPLPPVASGVGHVRLLKRRLTMILRGTTPQSLTRTGLLALAGLGVFLLPFVPGWAQVPPEKTQAQKDIELQRAEQQAQLDQAQRELAKALALQQGAQEQRDVEERRALLEKQLKELTRAIELLKAQAAGKTPVGAPPGAGASPGAAMPPGGKASMGGGGAMGTGAAAKPATIEQRLEQVERKLDVLLWEITNMRRDMSKGPQGFGGGGTMIPPGWGTPGGGRGFAGGSGGGGGIGGGGGGIGGGGIGGIGGGSGSGSGPGVGPGGSGAGGPAGGGGPPGANPPGFGPPGANPPGFGPGGQPGKVAPNTPGKTGAPPTGSGPQGPGTGAPSLPGGGAGSGPEGGIGLPRGLTPPANDSTPPDPTTRPK